MMGKGKGKQNVDRAADAAMRRQARRGRPDRRRDAARVSSRCPGPGSVGTGREGPAQLGRATRRLEDVRQNRADGQLHTLGAIWHRTRLTCPGRQQLGSYLLDALDPELASYLTFHIEVVECPFCKANLDDLKMQTQTTTAASASKTRQHRILQSSQHLLNEDKRG